MLQLYNINKKYITGSMQQSALNNLNLCLRDNEFVAILGPSGSGKTTMLNIIGGLDRYDSGDLIINGTSTRGYTDRQWDSYRNHSIGFVFQSYNLIPHQTVLANVELALTISGVSRAERKERAINALEKVGLKDHIHKKPNQMSGGQMQRVAIARALVNNPDILLADEPTGALDTDTSLQVMELLKEVAKDRLVVMVTHNPELAEQYANRIVRLRDGVIVEDSNPYIIKQEEFANAKKHNNGKASMSFFTALSLSFNNLRTKLARTLLTSFAGSIGIIGIAAILALSSGVNNYINDIQKQTMNSYPLTISSQAMDTSLMEQQSQASMMMVQQSAEQPEYNGIYASYMTLEASSMVNSVLKENDLKSFKQYLDNPSSEIHQYLGESGVVYSYNLTFDVFSYDSSGVLVSSDADITAATELNSAMSNMGFDMSYMTDMFKSLYSSVVGSTSTGANNFSELLPGNNGETVSTAIKDSYDLLYGTWPENYDEVVLVLDYTNSIDIGMLYQLGIITLDEYVEISDKIRNGETVAPMNWDYSTLCSHRFRLLPAGDRYKENANGTFTYITETDEEFASLMDNAIELKITGVIKPHLDADNATIITPVAYTSKLTDHLVSYSQTTPVVIAQQAAPETNVLTGTSFEPASDEEKIAQVKEYLLSLSDTEKATMYAVITMFSSDSSESSGGEASENTENQPEEEKGFFEGLLEAIGLDELFADNSATNAFSNMGSMMSITDFMTGNGLDKWLEESADSKTLLYIYDEYLGSYSYEDNMDSFGCISYESPDAISIYTDNFENKEAVSKCIENYNATVTEDSKIVYSDTIAMITDSITSIVDVVSYVLIAFVAVSLIVSSIMIGIITYISVLERTKEIGILRSIGASKSNISQVFNAETLIIGLCSGLIGILLTQLIIIPANSIIHALTNNMNVSAQLPLGSAVVLIILSVILTLIGGLIPSRKASKKDPVTALRSE